MAEIVGGGTPSTNIPEYWDGDIDWYAPAEINDQIYVDGSERKITKLGLEKSSAKILPADITVLFTSRAGIGKTAILRRSGATNQGFQSMVLNDETNPYFVFSISKFIKEEAERVASGSTFAEVSGKMLGNLAFMFPTKKEQDKIGEYFSNLDNLITLHQRKLFLNFVKKNDWEQRKLGEICQRVIRKNKNNESDLPLTIASQYGLIDQRDFFNKVVAAKDMSNYYLLRKGEFAYNKSYSNGFEYGSIKRLNAYEQGCLSTLYICFEITSDEVDSDYLVCFFDTLKWYGDLSMICAEGARNHGLLNVDIKAFFADINVSTPTNLKEQRKIATYLNNLDHLITLHRRAYYNKKGGLTNVHNDNQQHYAIL